MSLDDLEFKNPTNMKICRDEIGKRCLQLTNEFRAKNKLPPLKWDDSIWRISYTHSKNMGDKKVPFGHKGFNERIRQFPFHFSLACENVFMCHPAGWSGRAQLHPRTENVRWHGGHVRFRDGQIPCESQRERVRSRSGEVEAAPRLRRQWVCIRLLNFHA